MRGIAIVFLTALFPAIASAQWTREIDVAHGAFDHEGAPDAIVHAPSGFDARAPLHLVVFLHGYRGCAQVLISDARDARCRAGAPTHPGWGLAARHDEAGTQTLFVVVQLALWQREGSPGRFAREGAFRTFLDEILAALEPDLGARRRVDDLAGITILAHSAAFETSLAILRAGRVDDRLRHLVLFDALYSGGPAFLAWAAADASRRLLSFHGGRGTTRERNRDLARRARRALGARASVGRDARLEHARDRRVVIVESDAPHADIPARHMAETLRALGLPLRR
ncbi:hypothetical protein [Sandaracinus amylolyticus]|uniref:Alpha/beta hydrolase n=1 Tax=Sandaracinus amylolyticus TaxID=927083 RepID=A0A0F6W554_9BACT|nr:hypothetical protein [Sandaracinus amylolyticus]AKF07540.1 hypothetical protein DB32_004689 [Sandaracinus amylolyticus]